MTTITIFGNGTMGQAIAGVLARGGADTITNFSAGLTVDGGAGTDTISLTATSAEMNAASDAPSGVATADRRAEPAPGLGGRGASGPLPGGLLP